MSVGNYQDSRDKPSTYIDRDPIDHKLTYAEAMAEQKTEATGRFMAVSEHMPTLFDLSAEELRLLSDLEEVYGRAIDPTDDEALADHEEALERLSVQFVGNEALVVRKVENYIGLLAHLDMLSAARKAQADRLAAKAKTTEAGAKWLKERLLQAMKVMGRDRIETPIGTVRIQANPPKVEVLEPMLVPKIYERTKITIDVDKRAILADYKANGEAIPGVEITRGESLRVS